MEKIRLGAVGLGGHGQWLLKAIKACDNLELAACCSTNANRAQSVAQESGCQACNSFPELLAMPEIQGVVITVPNYLHAEYVIAAAKAGKACFVEKPIANAMAEAQRMIDACAKHKVLLAVGHNFRRRAEFRKAYELIKQKRLGKIISCEANFSRPGALTLPADDWRRDPDKCPMPTMMQLGIHLVDCCLYLFGPAKRVSALELASGNNVSAGLEFSSGVLGHLGSNYFSKEHWFMHIYGTRANLYLDNNRFILEATESAPQENKLTPVDTLKEELYEFGEAIKGPAKVEVNGSVALESLKVVRAMIRSVQEKSAVAV